MNTAIISQYLEAFQLQSEPGFLEPSLLSLQRNSMVSGHLRRWISAFQQARDLIIMLTKIYSLRALMKTVLEAMSSERFFGYRLEISQRSLSTYCEICE